jgi:hypothetical protein
VGLAVTIAGTGLLAAPAAQANQICTMFVCLPPLPACVDTASQPCDGWEQHYVCAGISNPEHTGMYGVCVDYPSPI